MMHSNNFLRSLMKEVNLDLRIQEELLQCASSGKSFPYIPKTVIKACSETDEVPTFFIPRLPPRPIQRTRKTIEALGDYEREQFRPTPAKTRPPYEKQCLQNLMAYGKDLDAELRSIRSEETPKEKNTHEPIDLFSEILREIRERQQFLDDMSALGEGKKYLPEIQCQIALRLRELEKIDKERAKTFIQQYGLR